MSNVCDLISGSRIDDDVSSVARNPPAVQQRSPCHKIFAQSLQALLSKTDQLAIFLPKSLKGHLRVRHRQLLKFVVHSGYW